ncbi:MAG: hypothetical protein LBB77_11835 [Treponema sp.]|jgi:hypothetical protein|nr:hypothetical protein [Treponema sp.]
MALEVTIADLFAEHEPESMKIMASKKELKTRLEKLMNKAIDELFTDENGVVCPK